VTEGVIVVGGALVDGEGVGACVVVGSAVMDGAAVDGAEVGAGVGR